METKLLIYLLELRFKKWREEEKQRKKNPPQKEGDKDILFEYLKRNL